MTITKTQLNELYKAFEESYNQYEYINQLNLKIGQNDNAEITYKNKTLFVPILFFIISFAICLIFIFLGKDTNLLLFPTELIFLYLCIRSIKKSKKLQSYRNSSFNIATANMRVVKSFGNFPDEISYKTSFMYFYDMTQSEETIIIENYLDEVNNYIYKLANENYENRKNLHKEIDFYSGILERHLSHKQLDQ